MNILLLKNWKLIAVLICAVLVVSAWQYDHAAQYKRGRESMAAEISNRLKDSAIEKAKKDRETSAAYQTGKAVREEKERVRYVKVQKIVEKPVFRNICVDSDGLSVINAAIADGN
nr:MAG TPA: conotoxin [Caudoviricetes sp.]